MLFVTFDTIDAFDILVILIISNFQTFKIIKYWTELRGGRCMSALLTNARTCLYDSNLRVLSY